MNNKHIKEFLSLTCAPDLMALRVFPQRTAAKEITESMAAFDAVRRIVMPNTGIQYGDENVFVFAVGDGHRPRTGALFAMRTKWTVISIDPEMNRHEADKSVRRLVVCKTKIEDFNFIHTMPATRKAIIVLVHSHATIKACLESITGFDERHIVSIPCCVPQDIPRKVFYGYTDTGIWSAKNQVKIWLNV